MHGPPCCKHRCEHVSGTDGPHQVATVGGNQRRARGCSMDICAYRPGFDDHDLSAELNQLSGGFHRVWLARHCNDFAAVPHDGEMLGFTAVIPE
jgi:hypothetical protein